MTKNEFHKKFNAAYCSALKSTLDDKIIDNTLKSNADENRKISSEALSKSIFDAMLSINERILKSVLLELLEFDD